MSFVPLLPIDPAAVIGSLRVNIQNNVHAVEHVLDVTLDILSNFAHQSAVFMNSGLLSAFKMHQTFLGAKTCWDAWAALLENNSRVRDQYLKYLDECDACRHRAMDRLYSENGYAGR